MKKELNEVTSDIINRKKLIVAGMEVIYKDEIHMVERVNKNSKTVKLRSQGSYSRIFTAALSQCKHVPRQNRFIPKKTFENRFDQLMEEMHFYLQQFNNPKADVTRYWKNRAKEIFKR